MYALCLLRRPTVTPAALILAVGLSTGLVVFAPGSSVAAPVVILEPIGCEATAGYRICPNVADLILRGAERYGYWSWNIVYKREESLTDDPSVKLSYMSEAWLTGDTNMFYGHTHGTDGGMGATASDGGQSVWEYFAGTVACTARLQWYLSNGWTSAEVYQGLTHAGVPAIGITCQGIRNRFRFSGDANGLMKWCWSSAQRDSWMAVGCDAVHAYLGPTSYSDCPKYEYAASILSCEQYFNQNMDPRWEGFAKYATVGQHPLTSWYRDFDSPFNTMRPGKSCKNTAVTFGARGVEDAVLFFEAVSERDIDHYDCVGGYRSAGGPDLRLAGRIPADPRGGPGKGVHYLLPGVSMDYDFYAVYAFDSQGSLDTQSEEFYRVEDLPRDWDAWLGGEVYDFSADAGGYREADLLLFDGERFVPGRSHLRHSEVPFRMGGRASKGPDRLTGGMPDTTLVASVIVYSSRDCLALPVYERIREYQTPSDRTICVLGSDNPDDARAWYEAVQWANWDYDLWAQEHGGPVFYPAFFPGPTLVIAGDAGGDDERIVGYATWEDDPETHACHQPQCRSDLAMSDVWDEGAPGGPVLRISGDSVEDVLWQVEAARNFTNGVDVDPDYGALFLAGDGGRHPGTEIPRVAYTTEYVREWEEEADWVSSRGLVRNSDFATWQEGVAAIAALSERGTAFWFGFGWETRNDEMPTKWIYGGMDRSPFTRRQEVVWVFPGCEVANLAWDSWYPTVQEEWRDGDHTRLAAMLGGINASWSPDHELIGEFVAARMKYADGDEPLQVVWWEALMDACMQVPRLKPVVMGQAMLGAPIFRFSSSGPNLSVPDTPRRVPPECRVSALHSPTRSGEGTALRLEIPERGRVQVRVFDVRGRRVSEVADRLFDSGVHNLFWAGLTGDGTAVGPGVYFVHVTAPSGRATSKVVVVP